MKPEPLTRLTFELNNNHIMLEGRINHSAPLRFYFDTGAQMSTLYTSAMDNLGLHRRESGGRVKGTGVGDQMLDVAFVRGLSLQLGSLDMHFPRMLAIPLDAMLAKKSGQRSHGILGYDLISQYVIEIDYAHRQMGFYDPATYQHQGPSIPITVKNNLAYVRGSVTLPGGEALELNWVIDTGCSYTLILTAGFVQKHNLLDQEIVVLPEWTLGVGGLAEARRTRIERATFDSFVEDDVPVLLSLSQDVTATFFEGILGGGILRRYTVVIDYPHNRLFLTRNEYHDEPYRYNLSGLLLTAAGEDLKTIVVEAVADKRPGALANMLPGDILHTIDGQAISTLTLADVYHMLSKEGCTPLTILRDGKEYHLTLDLHDQLRRADEAGYRSLHGEQGSKMC